MFTQSFTYPIDIGSNPFLFEDAQDNPGTMSIDPTISKREGDALMQPRALLPPHGVRFPQQQQQQ